MREVPAALRLCGLPQVDHVVFEPAERLLFRNAGVGHPVHAPVEQVLLFLRREVAVVRHSRVVAVRHEVHDVFLEVRARARNDVHFVLADHLGEGFAQFSGAHRPGEGDHHFAPCGEVGFVRGCGLGDHGGVEVLVVSLRERADESG